MFISKVHYPNNKNITKQNVYMNKDSKITKVEVIDKDNNVLISMNYNKVEYDKKFDKDYFELNSILNINETKTTKDTNTKNQTNDTIEEKNTTNKNSTNSTENNKVTDKEDNTNKLTTKDENNNYSNSENKTTTDEPDNTKEKTEQTLSIEDIIYPMYLPDNTYLTNQERIDTENGERLILTFGGDNSFVLVEETISANENNLIIPVSGEFDFLSDVIGVIGTNSVMWHSNGIEYYMTSNTMETSTLVDIARSISVLPVSK